MIAANNPTDIIFRCQLDFSFFNSNCLEGQQVYSSQKIRDNLQVDCLLSLCRVGVRGLELPTSTSRTWRANQLCYTPIPCFRAAKVQHFLQLTIKKLKKLQF